MSSEQCELLRQLSSNYAYQIVIAVKCAACLLGACGLCYQWHKQGVRFLVHANTKVLFNFYFALNLLLAVFFSVFYIFELVRMRFDCFVVNFRIILLTKGAAMSFGISAHNIIMLISLERLYSAIFPARFEKHSNKRITFLVAMLVVILSWTFVMSGLSDGFTLFETRMVALLEDKIPENANSFSRVVIFMNCSYAFSLSMFCFDLYVNFVKERIVSSSSLSISYQRSENKRIILVILPIEVAEALLAISSFVMRLLHSKVIDITMPIERLFFMEILLFPMFFPLILAVIIEFRVARRVRTVVRETYHEVDHFESLRRAWQ